MSKPRIPVRCHNCGWTGRRVQRICGHCDRPTYEACPSCGGKDTLYSLLGAPLDLRYSEQPDEVILRGHGLDSDQAAATAADWLWENWIDPRWEDEGEPPLPKMGDPREMWGRWVLPPPDADFPDGCTREFRLYYVQSRGAMAVTVLHDLDERERLRKSKAAQEAHAADLEARVLAAYPEAEIVRSGGFPVGEGWVIFTLPGLEKTVLWNKPAHTRNEPVRSWCLRVFLVDMPAWKKLYAERARPEQPE